LAWRIGRWLYQGSRRETANGPVVNGEYLLQAAWVKASLAAARPSAGYEVVDVGANVGAWSANLIGELDRAGLGNYRLWAFEPAPAQRVSLSILCRDAITAGSMIVDPRGLAAEPGKARFNVVGDVGGTNALASDVGEPVGGRAVEIAITTLDALCAEHGIARLHLVKVDTEGNDFNVILGARGLFDSQAIDILQFEYNWRWVGFGRFLHNVFDFLDGRPYRLGRLTEAGIELYDRWHPELERFIETNYVIAHRDALAPLPHWRAAFDDANTAAEIPDR
jgi:FkbM family methyltransferase